MSWIKARAKALYDDRFEPWFRGWRIGRSGTAPTIADLEKAFLAGVEATLQSDAAKCAWGYEKVYPLDACVWFRTSTRQWVLEIAGTIEDTAGSWRHAMPAETAPVEVPGLQNHYDLLSDLFCAFGPPEDDYVRDWWAKRSAPDGTCDPEAIQKDVVNRAAELLDL